MNGSPSARPAHARLPALLCALGLAGACSGAAPIPPPRPAPSPPRPTASASAAPEPPAPVDSVEPRFDTLVFSEDEVWSAVAVELRPSGDHATAIVEERDGARRLVRLAARGRDVPEATFVAPRRLTIQANGSLTVYDLAAGRELTVPSGTSHARRGARWVTLAPDGEILFVDTDALAVAARSRIEGITSEAFVDFVDKERIELYEDDTKLLVVADAESARELWRFEGVTKRVVDNGILAAVIQPTWPAWSVALFDLANGRIRAWRTFDVGQMAYGAELATSPDGRELVVATLYTSRGGGEELRFDLVDVATGAVRVTRRMRPTWASGHLHPMLTVDGTVCLSPDDDMGTYVLEPRPAFDLRRGTPMKPSPTVDRLCFGDGVLELPAALRGPGRAVVPSVQYRGFEGILQNDVLGPNHLLARVETDVPKPGGDALVGGRPTLAFIDLAKKTKLGEISLPSVSEGVSPSLDMRFSPGGERLAACWNLELFLVDVAAKALVAPPRPCTPRLSFSPRGRYLLMDTAPLDAATGKPLGGPWWTTPPLPTGGSGSR